MIQIKLAETIDNNILIIEIEGALNSDTSLNFEKYIDQLCEKNDYIIIDAKNLEYISSEGIGVILYIQKKIVAKNGFLVIYNISQEILTLFKLLGFNNILTIAVNRDEAIQIMNKQLDKGDHSENIHTKRTLQDKSSVKLTSIEQVALEDEADEDRYFRPNEEIEFKNPLIIECANCKGLIRVKKDGNYICPDCKAEFSVKKDQTIQFN
ncbi:MAG: anti-sigma factor antagonist [Spirochaetota bacterium]|nr:anti-sigma factor antagonist [Spirochaetota bacterium]